MSFAGLSNLPVLKIISIPTHIFICNSKLVVHLPCTVQLKCTRGVKVNITRYNKYNLPGRFSLNADKYTVSI